MKGGMRTYLSVVAVLACFAACAEPLAPPKEATALRSVNQIMNEVTSEAEKTGKRVLRRGQKDELVLDVANSTLSARGRTVRIPQQHLAMMVESFDGINTLDQFFQGLHRDPKYLESVEAGKRTNVRLKVDVSRGDRTEARQSFAPMMSVVAGTPTTPVLSSTNTVDLSVSGVDCASLNATLSSMYTAFHELKDSWEEKALAAAAMSGGVGIAALLQDPMADISPAMGGGMAAAMLFAELSVIWSEILHMKLSISIFEGMMVAQGCVTVLPPVLVVPDPVPTGGGSGGEEEELCYYHYRLWVSEDGGQSWYLAAETLTIAPC